LNGPYLKKIKPWCDVKGTKLSKLSALINQALPRTCPTLPEGNGYSSVTRTLSIDAKDEVSGTWKWNAVVRIYPRRMTVAVKVQMGTCTVCDLSFEI